MTQTLDLAEPIIQKWNPESSNYAKVTSLFYESRGEAREFIKCVKNLRKAMQLIAGESSTSELLVQAQNLMEIAMKRLKKEFYQILSMNRAQLDPESVSTRSSRASNVSTRSSTSDYDEDGDGEEDEIRAVGESIYEVEDAASSVMNDLKLIAESMILCGYGKECVKMYKVIRKSIIDEAIYRLGVDKLTSTQITKMDWEVLDLKIQNWLNAVKIAVTTLFDGERILSDHVFASSDSIRESVFADISKEAALILFGFPENVAKSKTKLPERMFRMLDMYMAISNHWQDIGYIFSVESTSPVESQALASLIRLGESVKTSVAELESAIQKDKSKVVIAGAGIHHLTIEAMNHITLLADYSGVLSDILADSPPILTSSMPESYFDPSEDSEFPGISLRFAWLILVLLCKLDVKAEQYKDTSFTYLFLANNLQHVITQVRTSNLQDLLGDNWIKTHEIKVKQFAATYERQGWGHVISLLPDDASVAAMSPEEVKDWFKKFHVAFEHAYHKHSVCVVQDSKLRDEIKLSLARKVMPVYRELYKKQSRITMNARRIKMANVVRYTPDDLANQFSDLFFGDFRSP
jgi:exocyst complex protein 7